MSALFSKPTATVFIEFTENAAHIAGAERSLDLPIERDAAGALTTASFDSVANGLRLFADSGPSRQALCLLPARGVSIRRISLPASCDAEIERLLPLQIEAHFPLSAEELAWGYSVLIASAPARGGAALKELLVAAARKDSLQQYRNIISAAGFEPVFAIAALAREELCAHRNSKFGILEIGAGHSELLTFDESGPATLRVVSLGAEQQSAEPLLSALRANGAVDKIFVSGKSAATWSARISTTVPAEPLPTPAGQSTAIAGLRESLRRGRDPLLLHVHHETAQLQRAPTQWRWAAAASILLLISLGLRYAEPMIRKKQLSRTIAELSAASQKIPKIDREAAFLQFIHTNQPGYLEVIHTLADAAQPGTKLDSLNLNRRGDLSMRGSAQGAQQAAAFRSKLIDSGFFADVVLDEQTPVQNQQQVNFRMTAQVLPESLRKPPAPKPSSSSTNNQPAGMEMPPND